LANTNIDVGINVILEDSAKFEASLKKLTQRLNEAFNMSGVSTVPLENIRRKLQSIEGNATQASASVVKAWASAFRQIVTNAQQAGTGRYNLWDVLRKGMPEALQDLEKGNAAVSQFVNAQKRIWEDYARSIDRSMERVRNLSSVYGGTVPGFRESARQFYTTQSVRMGGRDVYAFGAPESSPRSFYDQLLGKESSSIGRFKEIESRMSAITTRLGELKKMPKDIFGSPRYYEQITKDYKKAYDMLNMELHGMKGNNLSIRNFSLSLGILKKDMMDLMTWQARWYGAKALVFTPLQIAGSTIKGYIEWQQAMQNAAAVSNYTEKEISKLKEVTMEIGKQTPISAKEASKALLEFAQAGLDASASQKMLPLASKMVVATQEDMKVAVSALTTAYYAWKLEAKDMPAVADQIAASMADSKLKVEDLATIFNYLGTMAKQAGMDVSDTLTLVTVMSKAGVKPSTIGTGLTQAIVALTKMAPKLREEFTKLRLDWREFQIPQNNPLEVFKKLASSGIDLTSIFKGFETRAGRSVAAIVNQGLQMIDETNAKIKEKGFLDKAFETSMNAIENQAKRFRNILESDIFAVLDVGGGIFAKFLKTINDMIEGVNGLSDAFRLLISTIFAGGIIALVRWLSHLVKVQAVLTSIAVFFSNPASWVAALTNPWVLAAVAVGTLITALLKLKDIFADVKKVMQEGTSEDTLRSLSPFAIKQRYKMISDLVERMEKTKAAGESTDIQPGELAAVGVPGNLLMKGQTRALEALKKYQRDYYSQLFMISEKGPAHMPPPPPPPPPPGENKKTKDYFRTYLTDLNKKYSEEVRIIKENEKQKLYELEASHKLQLISDEDFYKKSEEIVLEANIDEHNKIADQVDELNKLYREKAKPKNAEEAQALWNDYKNKYEELMRRILEIETEDKKKIIDTEVNTELKRREILDRRLEFTADMLRIEKDLYLEGERFKLEEAKKERDFLYEKKLINATDYYNKEEQYAKKLYEIKINLAENEYETWKKQNEDKMRRILESKNIEAQISIWEESVKNEKKKIEAIQKADEEYFAWAIENARKTAYDLQKVFEKAGYGLSGSLAVAKLRLSELSRTNLDMATNVADSITSLSSAMESAFMDFLDHTSEGFLKWENLVTNVLNEITKELIKVYIVKQLIGGIQGVIGGWFSSGETDVAGLQNLMPGGYRASGGPVSLNRAYLVGEQGPELFIPNSNGNIVPNGQLGNNVNVLVNVTNNTKTPVNAKQSEAKFDGKKYVVGVILEELSGYGPLRHAIKGVR
jgi:TP901 family phage tail tape measure protein